MANGTHHTIAHGRHGGCVNLINRTGWFATADESHRHSLDTLNRLYEYDDFMDSVSTVADMGSGAGLDLEWWATRTTRDDTPRPLNIKCWGIDRDQTQRRIESYPNISYIDQDFEDPIRCRRLLDVVWSHNSLQYAVNPLATLSNWWHAMGTNGMLVVIVPQTTNLAYNRQEFEQRDGVYHHWSMVSLIHCLAVSGFDCGAGFFRKSLQDPWLHAAVYKSEHEPMDPRTTRWYDLRDRGLLPTTAADSVFKWGFLKQKDLVLPWLNKMLYGFGDH